MRSTATDFLWDLAAITSVTHFVTFDCLTSHERAIPDRYSRWIHYSE